MRLKLWIPAFVVLLFFSLSFSTFDSSANSTGENINLALASEILNSNAHKPTEPVRLQIPSIEVNAQVESLGLTSSGAMEAPRGPDNVGWYNQGPVPGNVGNSVMDGHSGWKDGKAVFDDLRKLKIGDKIYVQDSQGSIRTFIVRELKYYDKDANTNEVFKSSDGKSHLNLITCAGDWDNKTQSSSERLVVFSDLEIK